MSFPISRLAIAAFAAALLAACGGPKPEPIPAPEPVVEAPPEVTPPAETPEDEDHAHEDEETAGGAPHVHGLAELAISREGNRYLGELVSPMANLGLSESDGTYTDVVIAELSGVVELEGGTCDAAVPHPMTNNEGGHTDSVIHFAWTCAKPDDVRAIRFAGFEAFPAFETVSTVYLTDTNQIAGDLTPASPELSLK